MLAVLALSLPTASADTFPAGAVIDQAAVIDITPEGFESVAQLIPALLPSSLPLGDLSGGYDGVWGQCWLGGYEYSVAGLTVRLEVADARIVPGNGVLDVTADLLVYVNDASDTFDLYTELECIGDTCYGYVEPFTVTFSTTMALAVTTDGSGARVLDATIGTPELSYSLESDAIHLDDCAIGTIEEILGYVGLSIYDLVLGQLDGVLESAVSDIAPELEAAIEGAFASATISQDIALGGATAHLDLYPSAVGITPAGVRLTMSGGMSADAAAVCISAYDPGGSEKTTSDAPGIGVAPSGVDDAFHAGIALSDDFANQALYALWRAGLLCYTLEPGGSIPLDTGIFNALTGDVFADLFPESQPVMLRTVPRVAPTAIFDGEHSVDLALEDLGVQFFAELDGRQARIVTIALTGAAGADLAFDGTTGELGVEIDLDASAFTPTAEGNEFAPDENATIEAAFSGGVQSVIDTVVGGLLEGLTFPLPGFSGIGVTDLQVAPSGDWLGLYAWLGPVAYEGSGCSSEDGGCSGGCTVGGTAVPGPLFWGVAALVLMRRRR